MQNILIYLFLVHNIFISTYFSKSPWLTKKIAMLIVYRINIKHISLMYRDRGVHTVCAQMTEQFLAYTKTRGNDLSTPHLPWFPGLRPGDRWCLCVRRYTSSKSIFKCYELDFFVLTIISVRKILSFLIWHNSTSNIMHVYGKALRTLICNSTT